MEFEDVGDADTTSSYRFAAFEENNDDEKNIIAQMLSPLQYHRR